MAANFDMSEFTKKEFLNYYLLKQRELSRRQREYKCILSTKLKNRKETICEQSYQNTIEQLNQEKDTLRAQIWVAGGMVYQKANNRALGNIECHVRCQEHLAEDIRKLKVSIINIEREISRLNKQVYDLNRKTIPDSQHQEYVARARKMLTIVENQYEVGVKRECNFTAINTELREELIRALHHRTCFDEMYTKLVLKLNSDKKYIVDLIEYALNTFDNCITAYEKINNLLKKDVKECELRKIEMQGIMRRQASESDNFAFLECKAKAREMDDLQPKEYRRREEFRQKHRKKIDLYNHVLEKILAYTESEDIQEVIDKFQEQESLYYSYFNYANELSYHMTLLNNSVNLLYSQIAELKHHNHNSLQNQLETIDRLEDTLKDKVEKNSDLSKHREHNEGRIEKLLQAIELIKSQSNANTTQLNALLGDYSKVNLWNMRNFLKILEKHISKITCAVYAMERQDKKKNPNEYTVMEIDKQCDWPTNLDEIVLTQQCPECAEGDVNVDDGDGGVAIHDITTIMKKLYEKVNQPEMQYRLHSISQCRLPRSRVLAAKRNM